MFLSQVTVTGNPVASNQLVVFRHDGGGIEPASCPLSDEEFARTPSVKAVRIFLSVDSHSHRL
jgi:hypothetical protein